jgi:hypothetical protein
VNWCQCFGGWCRHGGKESQGNPDHIQCAYRNAGREAGVSLRFQTVTMLVAGGIAIGLTGIGLVSLAAYGIVRAIGWTIDKSI